MSPSRVADLQAAMNASTPRAAWWDRAALAIVVVTALACGAVQFARFRQEGQLRWDGVDNDRNSHYLNGLKLGLDVRNVDPRGFFRDLERIRTWPPLHALLVGVAVTMGGPDYHLAVLPNLLAWMLTAVLAFLLARRAAPPLAPWLTNLVAMTAAAFVLASPAHRVFATDFLLESLGACLTLAVLYAYVRLRATDLPRTRGLAILLTCLFLEKYNYWFLVLLALAACEAWSARARCRTWMQTAWASTTLRAWLRYQWRQPLNYVLIVLMVILWISFTSAPGTIEILGRNLRVGGKSENLWHITFLFGLLRVAVCWPKEGKLLWQWLAPAWRQLALWHAAPLAFWFALPKRLGYFAWYMSLGNGPNSDGKLMSGIRFYRDQLVEHYHAAPWVAILALLLVGCALLGIGKLRSEARVILFLLLIGTVLTVSHPNRKSRFVHSWIACAWVAASLGLAGLASTNAGRLASARRALAGAACVGLITCQALHFGSRGHSPEGGHFPGVTNLTIPASYLPWLADTADAAIFSTLPIQHFSQWTYLEQFPHRPAPEVGAHWMGPSKAANAQRFAAWLASAPTDKLVLVDIAPGSRCYFANFDEHQQMRDLVQQQTIFECCGEREISELGCRITLWRRAASVPGTASADRSRR